MKLPKEFYNGFIIFIGIGLYFLSMELLGLADVLYLRLFNILFVFYGTNRTLKANFAEGNTILVSNAVSALITSLTGVFLSIIGLIIYSFSKGGDSYVESLSKTFLFGGNPSVMTYSISLLFEGIVSAVIVTFMLMLYWDTRYTSDKHQN
ncbi:MULTISPECIES: hypothetical protein [Flavobacterium]|uniref:DUF4199 domain-containing protein n=1 Tax=Flavobacterium gawalongense TaxID=2594432 RepID=A0A553BDR1_9FLAO|nr:hypothetical protein [Flavobacterium gawalongense]TRX01883.1 hypothetical protein FNW33_08290 [Flavobacterium gawalongense]TRX06337.1 hypothetical protein FNW12_08825 [Flavobacterium gawalongense]TRX06387.1 hypothetical protein FNW11_14555 [Flavobacterium gawalongense]TRX12744.1 hypothetical protein FNW10_04125 [Flavobacterium gawalongense]TRX30467.1 hypothetical protein FNW38_03620 [Flavobacterium gawalongense]